MQHIIISVKFFYYCIVNTFFLFLVYNGCLILKCGLILAAVFLVLGLFCILFGAKPREELYRKEHDEEEKNELLREIRSYWICGILSFVISAFFLIASSFIPIDWFLSWRRKRRNLLNRRLRDRQMRLISFHPPDVEHISNNTENEQRF